MRKSQKRVVRDKLRQDGFVDNLWAIENKVSVRLGAIIHSLKADGMKFDEARSGFLPGTKNWRYYLLKPEKRRMIRYEERDGNMVAIEYYV